MSNNLRTRHHRLHLQLVLATAPPTLAGTARMKYAAQRALIRLMCSGRLDPTFVLKALADGADGVLITGCHPGECHYIEQNYKALRRFHAAEADAGPAGHRDRSASSWSGPAPPRARSWPTRSTTMVEEVRALGPLNWKAEAELATSLQFSLPSATVAWR